MERVIYYLLPSFLLVFANCVDNSEKLLIEIDNKKCGLLNTELGITLVNFNYTDISELMVKINDVEAKIIFEFIGGVYVLIPYNATSGIVTVEIKEEKIQGPFFEILDFSEEEKVFDFFVSFDIDKTPYRYENR